jgi:chorismate mutase
VPNDREMTATVDALDTAVDDVAATVEEVAATVDQAAVLNSQLEQLDLELLRLVGQRTAVAHRLCAARAEAGLPGFAHETEVSAIRRFRVLGSAGGELGALLVRLGRPIG